MQAALAIQTHEEQLDMETAWAVGFNALSLSEEEEGLLPEGSNQGIYCKARAMHTCCFPATPGCIGSQHPRMPC